MGGHRITGPGGLGVSASMAGREGSSSPHPRVHSSLASWTVFLGWVVPGPTDATWCPAQAPRVWGKGWRPLSVGGTQPLGGAPQQLSSRGPSTEGGPQGGQGGTGAGRGAPWVGHATPIHGCKCRSAPCGPQRPMREKQKGGGQHGVQLPSAGSKALEPARPSPPISIQLSQPKKCVHS